MIGQANSDICKEIKRFSLHFLLCSPRTCSYNRSTLKVNSNLLRVFKPNKHGSVDNAISVNSNGNFLVKHMHHFLPFNRVCTPIFFWGGVADHVTTVIVYHSGHMNTNS